MIHSVLLTSPKKRPLSSATAKNNFAALSNPVPEVQNMNAALENIGFKVIRADKVLKPGTV